MAEEITTTYPATEIFTEIRKYWEDTALKLMGEINIDMGWEEIRSISEKFLQVSKDQTVNGEEITCIDKTITGNDQKCVRGTILDVYVEDSMIAPIYKKFTTIAKILINLSEGGDKSRWNHKAEKWCPECVDATKESCIGELKKCIDEAFGKGGLFDQAMELAEKGDWQNGTTN